MTTSEPSPADELRTAAATLRKWSTAAHADAGAPWESRPRRENDPLGPTSPTCTPWASIIHGPPARVPAYVTGPVGRWMALMDPGMGPLLADWLEAVSSDIGDHSECIGKARCELASALRIARHINTKEPSA